MTRTLHTKRKLPGLRQRSADGGEGIARGLMIVLGAAAVVVAVAGLHAVAWLASPLLLALIIVIAVSPVQSWLRRKGWPSWAATLVLVIVIYAACVAVVLFVLASFSQLSALLTQNAANAKELESSLATFLTHLGFDPEQARSTASSANLSKLAGPIESLLADLGGVLLSVVFILALILFLAAESGAAHNRMAMIGRDRPHMVGAMAGFVRGTRRYLVVTAIFGLIVAVLDGVALAIMGVPLVVLWAVLSFITNFIPNVGFIMGLVPPVLTALLTSGWQLAIAVIVVYCVLNAVVQSLIQPRFVGGSVGLSATVTFLALLFWAWVLGPLGALLAVPLTLLVKAILVDADPRAQWVEALIGSAPAEPTPSSERVRPLTSKPRADRTRQGAARMRAAGAMGP